MVEKSKKYEKSEIAQKLAALRNRTGLSMEQTALALGRPGRSSYQHYETTFKGPFIPIQLAKDLIPIFGEHGVQESELLALAGLNEGDQTSFNKQDRRAAGAGKFEPIELQRGPRDLPVLGAAKGGQKGYFNNNGEVFEYIERPGSLFGVADAYAVYMVGDSMEERYYAGEKLYVHPFKPVRQGSFVCVQLYDEDGEREYLIKQFVRQDSKRIRLREFKPEVREFDIPQTQLIAVHRIMGTYEE